MGKLFQNEYLVKAWEGCAANRHIARKHYTLSVSGKFFVATKTGLLIDTSDNIRMNANIDIAKTVDEHIMRKGWQRYSVEEIASRMSERMRVIDAEGIFDFTELEIMLIEKFAGAEDGIEAVRRLEQPTFRKIPSLTYYE